MSCGRLTLMRANALSSSICASVASIHDRNDRCPAARCSSSCAARDAGHQPTVRCSRSTHGAVPTRFPRKSKGRGCTSTGTQSAPRSPVRSARWSAAFSPPRGPSPALGRSSRERKPARQPPQTTTSSHCCARASAAWLTRDLPFQSASALSEPKRRDRPPAIKAPRMRMPTPCFYTPAAAPGS